MCWSGAVQAVDNELVVEGDVESERVNGYEAVVEFPERTADPTRATAWGGNSERVSLMNRITVVAAMRKARALDARLRGQDGRGAFVPQGGRQPRRGNAAFPAKTGGVHDEAQIIEGGVGGRAMLR